MESDVVKRDIFAPALVALEGIVKPVVVLPLVLRPVAKILPVVARGAGQAQQLPPLHLLLRAECPLHKPVADGCMYVASVGKAGGNPLQEGPPQGGQEASRLPGRLTIRLFRLVEDRAVINRFGFNNGGQGAAADRIARYRRPKGEGPVIGINIGANKDATAAGRGIADYVTGVTCMAPLADYLTVNISSPNTPGLRALQGRAALDDLLGAVMAARGADPTPIFLKVAPDLDPADVEDIAAACIDHRVDALIVSNTTISRPGGAVATDDLLAEEQRLAASRAAYDAACAASVVERAAAEADGTAKDLPLGPDFDKPPGTAYPRERLREKPRATVQQVTEKINKLPGAALGGYMPLRGDFDVEHDNEVSDGWSGRVCACGRAEWTGTGNAITRNKQ